jgi:2-keto-4-pentenoate hydratase/2-oxohepta-3-ene-1,7-dioic acid hydratase in catechol pathway
MKLATFKLNGRISFGAVVGDEIADLAAHYPDMLSLLDGSGRQAIPAKAQRIPASAVEWQPPIARPGKIVCVGLNYRSHLALLDDPTPEAPVLFTKPNSALIGSGRPILLPHVTSQVDYEGELAVVIGRKGKYIDERDALRHVAGYTCANDVSAHDIEFRTSQWTSGKMLDTFCPLGPYLLTADEVPDPNALRLSTRLNGKTVQDETTGDMLFPVATLVSYISSLATLDPGDIILTGTPAGLGCMRNPPMFLKPGDRVSVTIEGIGTLDNPVATEDRNAWRSGAK